MLIFLGAVTAGNDTFLPERLIDSTSPPVQPVKLPASMLVTLFGITTLVNLKQFRNVYVPPQTYCNLVMPRNPKVRKCRDR